MRNAIWCSLVLIALARCGSVDPAPGSGPTSRLLEELAFPRLKPAPVPRPFPQALFTGTLEIDGACLRLRHAGELISYLALWPPQVERRQNGVIDTLSGQTAVLGVEAQFGGGATMPGDPVFFELENPDPLPCPGPYWLVSGIVKSSQP